MSQFNPAIGAGKSGLQYRSDDNDGKQALLNHHKGSTAPTYAEAGVIWIDDTATPWLMKINDGTDWIIIGSVNATTNEFNPYINSASLTTATQTVEGIVEQATNAEVTTGTDTSRYVTPAGLAQLTASETLAGIVERATDAEVVTGTDTTRYITPKHLADNAGSFDIRTTAAQTITNGGALTIAHGHSSKPKFQQSYLKCLTAQQDYSIGDESFVDTGEGSGTTVGYGLSLVADGTNLNIRFGSGGFIMVHKTSGLMVALTSSNWELYIATGV